MYLCVSSVYLLYWHVYSSDRIFWNKQNHPPNLKGCVVLFVSWLVVSTHLQNIRQIGLFPQIGVTIKKYLKPPPSFALTQRIPLSFFSSVNPIETIGRLKNCNVHDQSERLQYLNDPFILSKKTKITFHCIDLVSQGFPFQGSYKKLPIMKGRMRKSWFASNWKPSFRTTIFTNLKKYATSIFATSLGAPKKNNQDSEVQKNAPTISPTSKGIKLVKPQNPWKNVVFHQPLWKIWPSKLDHETPKGKMDEFTSRWIRKSCHRATLGPEELHLGENKSTKPPWGKTPQPPSKIPMGIF